MDRFVIVGVFKNEMRLLRKGTVMTIAAAACREAYKKPSPEWTVIVMSYAAYLEVKKDASRSQASG